MNKFITLGCVIASSVLGLAGASCAGGSDDGACRVHINPDESTSIPLDENRLVRLETSDSSLIYSVEYMVVAGDKFVIKSSNLLKSFNAADGSFAGVFARQGQGPGEFSMITRLWADGDSVKLYDTNSRRVSVYLRDGSFVRSLDFVPEGKADHPLALVSFLELPDSSGYLGFNSYMGGTAKTNPQYSFIDKNLRFLSDVPGREMQTGGFANDLGYTDVASGRLLTWETLRDTVFSVTPQGVDAAYIFDYGDYAVPARIQALPERIERVMAFREAREKGDRLASVASFIQRGADGNYWFTFTTTDGLWHLARFAPEGGNAEVFDFDFGQRDYALAPFILADGDDLITVFTDKSDPEANPMLYRHPLVMK